jgi:secreted trypsin-like serine protease
MKTLYEKPEVSFLNVARRSNYRPRIVGGQEVKTKSTYPWTAALVNRGFRPARGQFCGGSLIAPKWVITAAHCPYGNDPDDFDVVLGLIDLYAEEKAERISIEEILIHPHYDPNTSDYDIALLRLSKASKQTTIDIIPAGDPDQLTAPGKVATAIGWGALYEGGPTSPKLMHVGVPIISNDEAHKAYNKHGAQITENMLAAGYPEGGKDACQGDSGGPLVVVDKNLKLVLAGVTSWGIGCARPELPGLYARLSLLGDWVRQRISS